MTTPVLSAHDLTVRFGGQQPVDALRDVTLELGAGEILALVGGSGSGKTTLARCLLGLLRPDAGEVRVDGRPLGYGAAQLRGHRRQVQLVPQDPAGSLNPRHPVAWAVAEGLNIHRFPRTGLPDRVAAALAEVGLSPPGRFLPARPRELSIGQQQRVALAAALALAPRVLVADEPLSALDPPARADTLALLLRLRAIRALSVLLITHDLAAAWQAADRLAVLHHGTLAESGPVESVLHSPRHPATRALLAAATRPLPRRPQLP